MTESKAEQKGPSLMEEAREELMCPYSSLEHPINEKEESPVSCVREALNSDDTETTERC